MRKRTLLAVLAVEIIALLYGPALAFVLGLI